MEGGSRTSAGADRLLGFPGHIPGAPEAQTECRAVCTPSFPSWRPTRACSRAEAQLLGDGQRGEVEAEWTSKGANGISTSPVVGLPGTWPPSFPGPGAAVFAPQAFVLHVSGCPSSILWVLIEHLPTVRQFSRFSGATGVGKVQLLPFMELVARRTETQVPRE